MTDSTVWTVILNYRTAEMTLQAAEAAYADMANIPGKIVIVDNDSGDGSFEALQAGVAAKGWPQTRIEVLQSGRNGGFGAGNNFGIRHGFACGIDGALPDYFFILNSDAFPQTGAINALRQHLDQHPNTGFAGSYIHGPDYAPHLTAFRFPSISGELEGAARLGPISRLLKHAIVPLPVPAQTCRVDWLAGASMMMRRQTLEEIGLFDEAYFLYFEETDLCLRAQRAGWSTDYVRESEVMHIGSVSTGMKSWQRIPGFWLDSRWHYFRRNHGYGYAIAATLAHLTGGAIARLRGFVQRRTTEQPKYFLIDMAYHAAKAAIGRDNRRQRKIDYPKGLRPLHGE
ncbi:glycosyltransferase family 2 protein [Cognatishimia sp. SS12]|uniref:glycosyltransferase family 2 protein n=1 Tax=Cognatishimia sp. SS12 TaxID=2979465 RepID=UPI0023309500|nr:glycosyltransferase family 2 protein [Cognatishimia sp. SS12]MDC0736819.1 glycosyltransferase family 2 protein [Cognatishimia sp. SS12]